MKGQNMFRSFLCSLSVLAVAGISDAADKEQAGTASLQKLLERKAQVVFDLADADQDGVLSSVEQTDASERSDKSIRQLIQSHTLAGSRQPPKIHASTPAVPNAITLAEFRQRFLEWSFERDAEVRTKNKGKAALQPTGSIFSNPPKPDNVADKDDAKNVEKKDSEQDREKDLQKQREKEAREKAARDKARRDKEREEDKKPKSSQKSNPPRKPDPEPIKRGSGGSSSKGSSSSGKNSPGKGVTRPSPVRR
jgi:DNA polymerase sigma